MANFILNEAGTKIQEYLSAIGSFLNNGGTMSEGNITAKEVSVTTTNGTKNLSEQISKDDLDSAVNKEADRAQAAETDNATAITAETERATQAEETLTEAIEAEKVRAKSVEESIIVDVSNYKSSGSVLPINASYVYLGLPVHCINGFLDDDDGTSYIAVCIEHDNESGYGATNHEILAYTSTDRKTFTFAEQFNTDGYSADTKLNSLEKAICKALFGTDATVLLSGLMSASDKQIISGKDALEGYVLTKTSTGVAWQKQQGTFLTDEQATLLNSMLKQQTLNINGNGNEGTFEVGTQVTPKAQLTVMYGFLNVTTETTFAPSEGSVSSDGYFKLADGEYITSSHDYTINASYNNKSATKLLSYVFANYRYFGVLDSKPTSWSEIPDIITKVDRDFSASPSLDETALAKGKYYFFAVVGTYNLVVKDAGTQATIEAVWNEQTTINRLNGTGSDTYTVVVVPASTSSNWSFYIERTA